MKLAEGNIKEEYTIKDVTGSEEMKQFLFSLGCYSGEKITIMSKLGSNYIINIKDGRYGIDKALANNIEIG